MVCVPTDGSNKFPVTPTPEKVPPIGEPISVMSAASAHTGPYVPALTTVDGFTLTETVLMGLPVALQPAALVAVTE